MDIEERSVNEENVFLFKYNNIMEDENNRGEYKDSDDNEENK